MNAVYRKRQGKELTLEAKYNKSGWLRGYRLIVFGDEKGARWRRVKRIHSSYKLERMGIPYALRDLGRDWKEVKRG